MRCVQLARAETGDSLGTDVAVWVSAPAFMSLRWSTNKHSTLPTVSTNDRNFSLARADYPPFPLERFSYHKLRNVLMCRPRLPHPISTFYLAVLRLPPLLYPFPRVASASLPSPTESQIHLFLCSLLWLYAVYSGSLIAGFI